MNNNIKNRKKVFEKIAQVAVPINPATPAAVTPPTEFKASALVPNINVAFTPISVLYIDQLVNLLNTALHYSTSGKINFQILKNMNFTLDSSGLPSPDQKNLVKISEKIYNMFLTKTMITPNQIDMFVTAMLASQEISNLSSVNPSGPIAQKVGNLRANIIIILNKLKDANRKPTT